MRNKRQYIWVAFYILCLLYITIFSRVPSLVRTIRPIPFWSYINLLQGNWDKGLSNCLNIGLFVPLGYLLTNFRKSKWLPIIGCLIATVSIEVIQYSTYFGYFDADDIISNFAGGCIGVAAWHLVDKRLPNYRKLIPGVLIVAGLIGCLITSKNVQYYETQFDFDIDCLQVEDGKISISGICDIYQRDSLDYRILLKSANKTITAETETDGNIFFASADTPDDEYEVYVEFSGYKPIATKTYISHGAVEYTVDAPMPKIQGTALESIVNSGKLKAFEPEYDVYVYQVGNRLYWLIGKDFDANLIYHLHTSESENLPENRKQYGFDNRFLPLDGDKELTKTMNCGKYRVFSDIIPQEYYVTAVMVGMNKGPNILWNQYFRPNRF